VSSAGAVSCAGCPVWVTCKSDETGVAAVAVELGCAVVVVAAGVVVCAVTADGYTIASPSESDSFFSVEPVDPVADGETESIFARDGRGSLEKTSPNVPARLGS